MSDGRTLEETLAALEGTIVTLAEGTAPLDELMATYERALELVAAADRELLELAEQARSLQEPPPD